MANATIYMQKHKGSCIPRFEPDILETKNYLENQIVEFKPKKIGAKKMRSLIQMGLYRSLVAQIYYHMFVFINPVDLNEWIKLKLGYVDSVIYIDGKQHMKTGSLAFDSMDHARFCIFVDKAIPFIADLVGVTEEELLKNKDTAL